MRRPVSTPRGLEPSKVAVKSGVIGHSVLPATPENAQPGTPQGADRMRVVLAPVSCPPVDLFRPRMPVAGGVGEGGDGDPQPLVAGAPEGRGPALARLQGYRTHAGVGGKRRIARVAASSVAQLGDQGR